MIFPDRVAAGRQLARDLEAYRGHADVIVLGLPRGGVPVAYEVASALGAPLDIFLVRKLGVPGQEEYAMGAIASGGVRVLSQDTVRRLGLTQADVERVLAREQRELARREAAYRGTRAPPELAGRTVILIDDGLATGSTMRAAVAAVRASQPARIVVAAPVAAQDTCRDLRGEADAVVCSQTPEPFHGVGYWYTDFSQTTDEEVQALLARARRPAEPAPDAPPSPRSAAQPPGDAARR
jgi:putative phosphoribosyl transferase